MLCRIFFGFLVTFLFLGATPERDPDSRFISFVTEPSAVKLYWKDDSGRILKSIDNLRRFVESKERSLRFAMNGGMYTKDNSPQGLFIQDGIVVTPLDTLSGVGNFYLKPNGVFYLTNDNNAVVCESKSFVDNGRVKFATQSGPMLLIDGKIHSSFKNGSVNKNIRNGVGILPGNKVIFAMSKVDVNFYGFAEYFKSMGCEDALYLDGFVSRTFLPEENWRQLDGNFGVMIGVIN